MFDGGPGVADHIAVELLGLLSSVVVNKGIGGVQTGAGQFVGVGHGVEPFLRPVVHGEGAVFVLHIWRNAEVHGQHAHVRIVGGGDVGVAFIIGDLVGMVLMHLAKRVEELFGRGDVGAADLLIIVLPNEQDPLIGLHQTIVFQRLFHVIIGNAEAGQPVGVAVVLTVAFPNVGIAVREHFRGIFLRQLIQRSGHTGFDHHVQQVGLVQFSDDDVGHVAGVQHHDQLRVVVGHRGDDVAAYAGLGSDVLRHRVGPVGGPPVHVDVHIQRDGGGVLKPAFGFRGAPLGRGQSTACGQKQRQSQKHCQNFSHGDTTFLFFSPKRRNRGLESRSYSFSAPTIMPWMKYFCRKG